MSPSKCSAQRMQSPLQLRVLLQGYTTGKVNLKVTQGFFPNSRSQSLSMTPPSPGSTRKAPRHRAGLTSEGTAPGAVSSCGPSPPPRTDGTSFSQAARQPGSPHLPSLQRWAACGPHPVRISEPEAKRAHQHCAAWSRVGLVPALQSR